MLTSIVDGMTLTQTDKPIQMRCGTALWKPRNALETWKMVVGGFKKECQNMQFCAMMCSLRLLPC